MANNIQTEEFIWGALLGGAIGITAALFLAPMSGESLRGKITRCLKGQKRLQGPKGLKRQKGPKRQRSKRAAAANTPRQ